MKKIFIIILLLISLKNFSQCPWSITNPFVTVQLNCGSTGAAIVFSITGSTSDLRYLITSYPAGTAFTPSNTIILNLNPILSGTTSQTVTVDEIGYYEYRVTNTITSCQQNGTFVVIGDPDFYLTGTAPTNSVGCNGVAFINPPIPAGCTVSINSGTLGGNSVTNLCYGTLSVCIGYTSNALCKTCKTLVIDGATGILENNFETELTIFPNPNKGLFTIQLNNNFARVDLVLFNLIGEKVLEMKLNEGENSINGKELPVGLYNCIISEEGRIRSATKLIIE